MDDLCNQISMETGLSMRENSQMTNQTVEGPKLINQSGSTKLNGLTDSCDFLIDGEIKQRDNSC